MSSVSFFEHFSGSPSINFCEPDFVDSEHIGEFHNTWSNLVGLYLGVFCLFITQFPPKGYRKWPFYLSLSALGPMAVYFGSIFFHAKLDRFSQLLDEVPMIFSVLYFQYVFNPTLFVLIICAFATVVIVYFIIVSKTNPLPLQMSYGILVFWSCCRAAYITWFTPESKQFDSKLSWFLKWSFFTYGFGVICWFTEQLTCERTGYIGLHALWHIFTGIGTYMWINFQSHLKLGNHAHIFFWKGVIPVVFVSEKSKAE